MAQGLARILTRQADRPALRYAMVGICSALAYNVILVAVHALGAHYLAAALAAFIVVVLGAYCAHAAFTFQVASGLSGLLRFVGTQILGFPISAAILAVLVDGASLPVWIATPIATLLLFAYNFLAARWAVAGKRTHAKVG